MSIRTVFMGTPQFAVPSLDVLMETGGIDLVGVVTQPDRPFGRGKKKRPSPVKQRALECDLTVHEPESIKDEAFFETLKMTAPDVIVTAAYGQLLPPEILDVPKYGCLNVHASLLPKYRGAAPIQWAVLNGEEKTGITIILMIKKLDAGDILAAAETNIREDEDAEQLSERLSGLAGPVLIRAVEGWVNGTIQPQAQDDRLHTYAPLLKKTDGRIDWSRTAGEIEKLVRGMKPWPGAFTAWNGKGMKIHRAKALDLNLSDVPGKVVKGSKQGLWIQTGGGILQVAEIQMENKARVAVDAFLQGHGRIIGETLGNV